MKRVLSLLAVVILLTISLIFVGTKSQADNPQCPPSCTDAGDSCMAQFNQCTNQLNQELQMSENATHPLQSQLQSMQQQIAGIKNRVVAIGQDLVVKQKNIDDGYKQIAQKEKLLNATIRNYYIQNSYNSPLTIFLSGTSALQITQALAYQKAAADQDKAIITNLAVSIVSLQQQKQELQGEEANLTALKTSLDAQSTELDTIIQGALAYQQKLTSQIAQLSAQQQSIIAAKLASLHLPTTAEGGIGGGCSSDIAPYKDPGFSGTKFGFFTYGVPHRVGMSQFGAKGRADAGEGYQQILSFYYPNTQVVSVNTSVPITVSGTNDYAESFNNQQFGSVEDYLKHIYEMPSAWNPEALKAQAIAARTYAMQAIDSGRTTVAPNQSFQEIKTELNAQSWIDAVNATQGQILESGGQPITAWFSSTGGGYTHNSGSVWGNSTSYTHDAADVPDGVSINSWADLSNNAYDGPNHANSNWFYCDWGGRPADNNTAWLQSSEVADIANAVKLAQISNQDPSITKHLLQLDQSNPDGNWDQNQVKQALQNQYSTTPMNSVSNISMSADFGSGKTTTVTISGDAGSWSFPGDFFKAYFNLRAPANIQIVGPLYNIEMR